ncbi:MAG: TldD/PmbA family protein [Dehalococcoidia bacterium]|nr:MAG: TldD/PmbA family protein [Dehalococcoidia bacterium]
MPHIEDIASHTTREFKKYKSEYIEARLEQSRSNNITYRGRKLESISKISSIGGNIRSYIKGGWGFASFNKVEDVTPHIEQAIEQARLVSKKEGKLAYVAPVTDTLSSGTDIDPKNIPLAKKKQLLDEYNEIIWRTPKLQTSVIGYSDSYKKSLFINSSGSFIRQERSDYVLRLTAIATNGSEVQQANISVGSRDNFDQILNLHSRVDEMANRSVELLEAPQIKGGEYTVVLDPVLAGVFVHEAFGHLSESDFVYENENMRQIMKLGKKFGSKDLSVIDSALIPDLRGSYKYDDEGVPASKTYLINEGVLVGRLHSRETAAKMGEKPTGNSRTINYRYPPIVRMTNTYIEPRKATFNEIIADIREGIYAKNWYGGTTSMEMFTFSAGEAYMIRNGKIAELIRPVVLSGNVFTTLNNIEAIGNDLEMNQGGGCGKGGQMPLPVANGSPHIRIRSCLVGGV